MVSGCKISSNRRQGYIISKLRPAHYKKNEDSFAWAEKKFKTKTCINIAEFNIHKYLNRDKGSDFEDFGKIIDYAKWARKLIKKGHK